MKNSCFRIAYTMLIFAFLLIGCNRLTEYRRDVDVEEIAETLTPMLSHPDTLVRYDADQIHFFLGLPEPYCTDSVVMVQTRAGSIDEYGIFLCKNEESAEELEEMLDDYLDLTLHGKLAYLSDCASNADLKEVERNDSDLSQSLSDLQLTGRVRRYGCYVCYTLLSDEQDSALQKQLKALLMDK